MPSVVTGKKQMFLNLGAQLMAFLINVCIGFFLTPYIVRNIGSTAYGFVGLANNFVNYVSIITIALNSMAGRFIALHYYRNDLENVQKYYTSVLYSNIVIATCLIVPCCLLVIFLDRIIDVPNELFHDVQILWLFLFGTMFISMIGSIFNNACYVKNRLELVSCRTVESKLIHAVLIICCFAILEPKLWYIGLASFAGTIYSICMNYHYTKKLFPFVSIKKKYFNYLKVIELIKSGVWNSIGQIGTILTSGLQLLITNIFIGATAMGVVAVAKTVPIYISSLFVTVSSVFAPQLTISYAQNDYKEMIQQIRFAMKLIGLFTAIPLSFFVVFGIFFYQLWVPNQNAQILTALTLVAIIDYPVAMVILPLFNVFTSANKVHFMSLVTIGFSSISCLTILFLLRLVDNEHYKMFIILGCGCFYHIIKNLFVLAPYSAKVLKAKLWCFYSILLRSMIAVVLLTLVAFMLRRVIIPQTWISLIVIGCIISLIGIMLSGAILLNYKEWRMLKNMLEKKFLSFKKA